MLFLLSFVFGVYSYRWNRVKALSFLLFLYLVIPPNIAVPFDLGGIDLTMSFVRTYFLGIIGAFVFLPKKNPFHYNEANKILIILIVFLFCSLAWGHSVSHDLKILFSEKLLLGFFGYYLFQRTFRKIHDLIYLLKILYLAILILSLYGLIEIITGKTIEDFQLVASLSSLDYSSESYHFKSGGITTTRGGLLRPSGTFWNNIIYAIALSFMVPYMLLCSSRFYFKNRTFKRSLVFLSTLLTVSRSGWFSLLLAFSLNAKKYAKSTFVIFSLFIFLLLPFLTADFKETGYADTTGLSFESRLSYVIPVFSELRFFDQIRGLGIGTFNFAIETGNKTTFISRLPADNTFGQFIFSYGFIGTFLFVTFFIQIFRSLSLKLKKEGNSPLIISIFTASKQVLIIQFSLFFLSNSLFQDVRLNLVFFSMFGAITSVHHKTK